MSRTDPESPSLGDVYNLLKHVDRETAGIKDAISKLEGIQEKVELLECKQSEMGKEVQFLRAADRRKGLVINGLVHEQEQKTGAELINLVLELFRKMELVIDEREIDYIRRARNKKTLIVKMVSELRRAEILRATKLLRGTQIYVNPDRDKKEIQERRTLLPFLKRMKSSGWKGNLRGARLVTEKGSFGVDDLGKLEALLRSSPGTAAVSQKEQRTDSRQIEVVYPPNLVSQGEIPKKTATPRMTRGRKAQMDSTGETRQKPIEQFFSPPEESQRGVGPDGGGL